MSSSRAAIWLWLHTLAVSVVGPLVVVQGESGPLALRERQLGRDGRPVDGQGRRARQDQHVGAAGRGHAPVHRVEQREHQAVLGTRHVLQRHSTSPSVQVTCRSRRCGASRPSSWPRLPSPVASASTTVTVPVGAPVRRLQHHGAIQVASGHRGGARRPDRPVAGLFVEEPSEDRRAVEAGEAQPVDRALAAHQRSTVPIRKECVVGYGGRAHMRSFAPDIRGTGIRSSDEAPCLADVRSEIRATLWWHCSSPDRVTRKCGAIVTRRRAAGAEFLSSRVGGHRRWIHHRDQAVLRPVLPEDIEWKPFPALPPSVRLAVVVGEPSEPGPYVVRVELPSGVTWMPHQHPEDRVYAVISGVFYIGLGTRFYDEQLQAIRPAPSSCSPVAPLISTGRSAVPRHPGVGQRAARSRVPRPERRPAQHMDDRRNDGDAGERGGGDAPIIWCRRPPVARQDGLRSRCRGSNGSRHPAHGMPTPK